MKIEIEFYQVDEEDDSIEEKYKIPYRELEDIFSDLIFGALIEDEKVMEFLEDHTKDNFAPDFTIRVVE